MADPDAALFRATAHVRHAEAARAAYLPVEDAERILRRIGYRRALHFDRRGTQGMVCTDGSEVVIAFRGTEGKIEDVLVDADARLVVAPTGEGRVHHGFLTAYQWARAAVWDAFSRLGGGLPLAVVGHSLGGALATLAAAEASLHTDGPVSLVTFGCPRVGDQDFCRALDEQLAGDMERIVYGLDVVPRLPTRLRGFDHVRRSAYIDQGGQLRLGAGFWELTMRRIAGGPLALRQPGLAWLADHSATTYVARLTALARLARA